MLKNSTDDTEGFRCNDLRVFYVGESDDNNLAVFIGVALGCNPQIIAGNTAGYQSGIGKVVLTSGHHDEPINFGIFEFAIDVHPVKINNNALV